MLIEYTLKQPNLDMLQDFKNQDKYSNMFSYSGKLTENLIHFHTLPVNITTEKGSNVKG